MVRMKERCPRTRWAGVKLMSLVIRFTFSTIRKKMKKKTEMMKTNYNAFLITSVFELLKFPLLSTFDVWYPRNSKPRHFEWHYIDVHSVIAPIHLVSYPWTNLRSIFLATLFFASFEAISHYVKSIVLKSMLCLCGPSWKGVPTCRRWWRDEHMGLPFRGSCL